MPNHLTLGSHQAMPQRHRGFTLLEVMIVIAIVGVLAAISYSAYTNQIAKTRRQTAKGALSEISQQLERFYNQRYTYAGFQLPYTRVPNAGGELPMYTLSFPDPTTSLTYNGGTVPVCPGTTNPDTSCYLVLATRNPAGPMKKDRCGDFFIWYRDGVPGMTGPQTVRYTLPPSTGGGLTADVCWR